MNDFSRADLDTLKAQVDLAELMRSSGIDQGRGAEPEGLLPLARGQDAVAGVQPEEAALQLLRLRSQGRCAGLSAAI